VSDIDRVYPPGQELAKGGQTGGLPAAAGKEIATTANANLAKHGGDLAK
jgi:hypothetical protein